MKAKAQKRAADRPISPGPGPPGMPQRVEHAPSIAAALEVAPGAIVGFVPRLHEGSYDAPDGATD